MDYNGDDVTQPSQGESDAEQWATENADLANEFESMAASRGIAILDQAAINDNFFYLVAWSQTVPVKVVNNNNIFMPHESVQDKTYTLVSAVQIGTGTRSKMLQIPNWLLRLTSVKCHTYIVHDVFTLRMFFDKKDK